MKSLKLVLLYLFICEAGFSQDLTENQIKVIFDKYGLEGCFVLFDQSANEFTRYNAGLCDTGYIPASTFKIPNSLIALEQGLVKDADQVIKWDGHNWPVLAWDQDQTLRSAMKYSCVWVYIGFAEQIGIEKYYSSINAFDYGNKNLEGPANKFWLSGPFRISANQQIDFLRKFYNDQLPVSKRSTDIVKDIIILEKTGNYILSGKTGGANIDDSHFIMWLVGYLEKDGNTWFYAMNFKTEDFDKDRQTRYDIVKDIFKEMKLVE